MNANPWAKFFWNDWETDPALRLCSLAAQGLWMRCLCLCAKADPKGFLSVAGRPLTPADLSSLVGKPEHEVETLLKELGSNGVFSRDRKGRIYSRRMVRDEKKSATARKNGKLGGNPKLRKQTQKRASDKVQDKPPDKPQKPEAISQIGVANATLSRAPQYETEFHDYFWPIYPHKVGKVDALQAFCEARGRAPLAKILRGLERYVASKPPDRRWCNPANFLSKDRWLDEPAPNDGISGESPGESDLMSASRRNMERMANL